MWSLKVVKGSELAEKLIAEWRLPLPLHNVTIGRDPASDWMIADRTVAISARHCEIVDSPLGPVLSDLSTNGTFVNGATSRLLGPHWLRDGDRLELGPFEILVSGPPMPPRPVRAPAPPATVSAVARSMGVDATAPQRGGDPAAMLAGSSNAGQQGLTEILLAAPPSVDSGLDLTRIRAVPSAPAALAAGAAPPAAAVQPGSKPPSPASAPTLPASAAPLSQALARGLGVPVSALEGQDLLQLVEQLAAAARVAHAALGSVSANMNTAKPPH